MRKHVRVLSKNVFFDFVQLNPLENTLEEIIEKSISEFAVNSLDQGESITDQSQESFAFDLSAFKCDMNQDSFTDAPLVVLAQEEVQKKDNFIELLSGNGTCYDEEVSVPTDKSISVDLSKDSVFSDDRNSFEDLGSDEIEMLQVSKEIPTSEQTTEKRVVSKF